MYKKLFSLFSVLVLFTACSSDGEMRSAERPANADSDIDVYESQLPEYVAGTQEDLVAHVGDRVFFKYASAELSSNAQRTLQRQAQWMDMNPDLSVTVEGHCDERGTREYNLALGEKRAASAKNYLVSLNIDPKRISIISYGKERPEDPSSNEVAWSKNRRAVTVVNE